MKVAVFYSGKKTGVTLASFELPVGTPIDDIVETLKQFEFWTDDGLFGTPPTPGAIPEIQVVFGEIHRLHVLFFPKTPKATVKNLIAAVASELNLTPTITASPRRASDIQAWWAWSEGLV